MLPLDKTAAMEQMVEQAQRSKWRVSIPHPYVQDTTFVYDSPDLNAVTALSAALRELERSYPQLRHRHIAGRIVLEPVHREATQQTLPDVEGVPT